MDIINDMTSTIRDLELGRSCQTRNTSNASVNVNFTIDFTGMTIQSVLELAAKQLTIDGQQQWAKLTPTQIAENVNGKTIMASSIGQRVQSLEEKIAMIENVVSDLGIPLNEEQQEKLDELKAQL